MIGELYTVFKTVSDIYRLINKDGKSAEDILNQVGISKNQATLARANGNMIEFLGDYVVNPTVFVTKNAMDRDDIDKIIDNTADSYIAFYVQCFKILTTVNHVDSASAIRILSNRKMDTEEDIPMVFGDSINYDSEDFKVTTKMTTNKQEDIYSTKVAVKTVELTLTKLRSTDSGSQEIGITIPIVFKVNVVEIAPESILNAVGYQKKENTIMYRWIKYRVGLLSLKEFLFFTDVADEYRESNINSDSIGTMIDKQSRSHISLDAYFDDKKLGLNKIVFSYIMTKTEKELIEKKMSYNLMKGNDKSKLMNSLMALNLTSINEDRETVNIFLNGLPGNTIKKISKLGKGDSKSEQLIEALALSMMTNNSGF